MEQATTVDARGPDSTRPSKSKPTPRASSLRNDIMNYIVDGADAVGSSAVCSPIPWKVVVPPASTTRRAILADISSFVMRQGIPW